MKKSPDPNAPLPPLPFHLHPPQKQELKKERLGLGVLFFCYLTICVHFTFRHTF